MLSRDELETRKFRCILLLLDCEIKRGFSLGENTCFKLCSFSFRFFTRGLEQMRNEQEQEISDYYSMTER